MVWVQDCHWLSIAVKAVIQLEMLEEVNNNIELAIQLSNNKYFKKYLQKYLINKTVI